MVLFAVHRGIEKKMCKPIDDKKCQCNENVRVICGCNICQRCKRDVGESSH